MVEGGITLSFNGKRDAHVISRKVMPRQVKIDDELSFNTESNVTNNILIEGENLQAMVTLYKYKGNVDLIITDPPYNTGNDFRYNDKWDKDPNDPYLGEIVRTEDGSKHTKWMKFMLPRLKMMKSMLKQSGVLAICIDERELFHLGMLLNEVFGEENRLGIINWQKNYSPKNDSTHISSATEYILVYAKDESLSKTNLLDRTPEMNNRYKNPDNDPNGNWTGSDPTASRQTKKDRYAIQSPFTGDLHYPGNGSWRNNRTTMKKNLEGWGIKYINKDLKDGREKALVIDKATTPSIPKNQNLDNNPIIEYEGELDEALIQARKASRDIMENGTMPYLYFLKKGEGRPRSKRYLNEVKQGKVPITFWADEDYTELLSIESQSWTHHESGHSQTGITELNNLLGRGHNFQTVKPQKLIEKIIQLWCPNNGLVLDPFAGSGTTGHAVMNLNSTTKSERQFILIEKGENDDDYTRTLTRERLKRAITGERVDKDGKLKKLETPLYSGFEYWLLKKKVDADVILKMQREELVDVIITSHWEDSNRKSTGNITKIRKDYKYLVGKNILGEGFFIVWDIKDEVGELNYETYMEVLKEAKIEGLKPPYHIYARYQLYQTPKVKFYQIPDKILMHLGLNENSDVYNNMNEEL